MTEKLVLSLPGAAGDGQTCTARIAGWMLGGCWIDAGGMLDGCWTLPQDLLDELSLLPLHWCWG